MAYINSECSDQHVHPYSMIIAVAVRFLEGLNCVYANSEGTNQTAQLCRLVYAFAVIANHTVQGSEEYIY